MTARTESAPPPVCGHLVVAMTGAVSSLVVVQYLMALRLHRLVTRVDVMLSQGAQRFVVPYALEVVSGNPVWTDTFQTTSEAKVPHIDLTRMADLMAVMPATANVIAKAACGIADDLVTTAVLAAEMPVVFVPAMNETMWRKTITQENVARLRARGYTVVEPEPSYEAADLSPNEGGLPSFDRVVSELRGAMAPLPEPSPAHGDPVLRALSEEPE